MMYDAKYICQIQHIKFQTYDIILHMLHAHLYAK